MPGRNTEEKDRVLLEIVVVVRGPWKKAFSLITQFKIHQSIINNVLMSGPVAEIFFDARYLRIIRLRP